MEYTIPILIPIVAGLTQVIKAFSVPTRFMPVVSIVIAVGLAFLIGIDVSPAFNLLGGIVIGLSASGLYDVTKKVIANK